MKFGHLKIALLVSCAAGIVACTTSSHKSAVPERNVASAQRSREGAEAASLAYYGEQMTAKKIDTLREFIIEPRTGIDKNCTGITDSSDDECATQARNGSRFGFGDYVVGYNIASVEVSYKSLNEGQVSVKSGNTEVRIDPATDIVSKDGKLIATFNLPSVVRADNSKNIPNLIVDISGTIQLYSIRLKFSGKGSPDVFEKRVKTYRNSKGNGVLSTAREFNLLELVPDLEKLNGMYLSRVLVKADRNLGDRAGVLFINGAMVGVPKAFPTFIQSQNPFSSWFGGKNFEEVTFPVVFDRTDTKVGESLKSAELLVFGNSDSDVWEIVLEFSAVTKVYDSKVFTWTGSENISNGDEQSIYRLFTSFKAASVSFDSVRSSVLFAKRKPDFYMRIGRVSFSTYDRGHLDICKEKSTLFSEKERCATRTLFSTADYPDFLDLTQFVGNAKFSELFVKSKGSAVDLTGVWIELK